MRRLLGGEVGRHRFYREPALLPGFQTAFQRTNPEDSISKEQKCRTGA